MTTKDPLEFEQVLFYGREYREVLLMLLLDEEDLVGKKILDCPSGPDSFVAESARRGFDVVGCDPLYARAAQDIVAQGDRDIRTAWESMKRRAADYPGFDIDRFHERKLRALKEFGDDFEAGKEAGRYLAAALPKLPFPDRSFDLVLSANLLFMYSSVALGGLAHGDTFDLEFHRQAVKELMRVSRGEVRLYPVMTIGSTSRLHSYAAQIIGQLAADGVPLTLKETFYDQASASGPLVLLINCAN
jgi:hypothetical protein